MSEEVTHPFQHNSFRMAICEHHYFLNTFRYVANPKKIKTRHINVGLIQNYCRVCNTELVEVPIIQLTRRGNLKGIKTLLGRRADPNIPSKLVDYFSPEGNFEVLTTALHLAFEKQELHIALWLMRAGARIDVKDALHKTPLDWFQYDGSPEARAIILFLIQHVFR